MAEFHVLPLYHDAFLSDTSHLGALETGAYASLLIASWRTDGGGLPDDEVMLGRMARCTPREWKRIRSLVMTFWTMCQDGKWRQKRLEIEREAARAKSKSASRAAKAKWLEVNKRHDADASSTHMRNACGSDALTVTVIVNKEEVNTPSPEPAREAVEFNDWPAEHDDAPATIQPPSERRTSNGLRRPPNLVHTTGPPPGKMMKRQDRAEGDLLNVLQTKLGRTPQEAWNLVISATSPEDPDYERARKECKTISRNFRLGWFPEEGLN